jgi:twitching motility protein PilT
VSTLTILDLLTTMLKREGSDLHLISGTPPQVRVQGILIPLTEFEPLSPAETQQLTYGVLNDAQKQKFEVDNELDFSFGIQGLARFRANVYRQRGAVAAAFRVIPFEIPTFRELGLPAVAEELSSRAKGLVLVTGPTGSGKSTTLAAMIDKINTDRAGHIVSLEDPIEFVHTHKKGVISQREVLSDTHSFRNALKSIVRQDADVVLIGEMRDLETIQAAITLAETGHLTLGTLHTNSSAQTINRIVDVFPTTQQSQVRAQLSLVLEGILSQMLVPRLGRPGRVMALEVLVATPAIRNMIREEHVHQIYGAMQAGGRFGMQTMNQSLAALVRKELIAREEAMLRSPFPSELTALLASRP